MSEPMHTILLVDDHPMMRRGLRQLLEMEPDFKVIAEANDGEEALGMLPQLAPDMILLDNNMPRLNGVETLKKLRQQGYGGKVLLFTVSNAEEDVRAALRHGADRAIDPTETDAAAWIKDEFAPDGEPGVDAALETEVSLRKGLLGENAAGGPWMTEAAEGSLLLLNIDRLSNDLQADLNEALADHLAPRAAPARADTATTTSA